MINEHPLAAHFISMPLYKEVNGIMSFIEDGEPIDGDGWKRCVRVMTTTQVLTKNVLLSTLKNIIKEIEGTKDQPTP